MCMCCVILAGVRTLSGPISAGAGDFLTIVRFFLHSNLRNNLHLSALRNHDRKFGLVVRSRRDIFDLAHDKQAIEDATENNVLVIEEVAFGASYEKLTTVGVLPTVGHRKQTGSFMLQQEALVRECVVTVNAHHARSVTLLRKRSVIFFTLE